MEDEDVRKLCQELNFQHLTDDMLGLHRITKSSKRLSRPRKHYVILKIDDFVGFIVDTYVAQLIMNIRQKFQVNIHILFHFFTVWCEDNFPQTISY